MFSAVCSVNDVVEIGLKIRLLRVVLVGSTATIFKVREFKHPEDEGNMFLRNF